MPDTGVEDVTVVLADDVTALQGVSVLAERGELLAVLGPSGSGKSTLLKVIAGLVPVQSGEVYVGGRLVNDLAPHRRQVAMVFEESTALPFMNVERNLGWGLQARHVPAPEAGERVQAQARGLRLGRFLPRMPGTLSSGELQRVGIGRALVHDPQAFLLDEPLANLDAAERRTVRHRIAEVIRGLGVAALYVTHDQEEAMSIGDRIALLNEGRLVQLGTPMDLYHRPVNLFAAGFVGMEPLGVLPARLVGSEAGAGFEVGPRTLPLWSPPPPALLGLLGRSVVLGLRPEDVRETTAGPRDPNLVTLPATVVQIEHLGSMAVVAVEVDSPAATDTPGTDVWDSPGRPARLRARFARSTAVRPGDGVLIDVDVTRAHVFDQRTGRALHHPES